MKLGGSAISQGAAAQEAAAVRTCWQDCWEFRLAWAAPRATLSGWAVLERPRLTADSMASIVGRLVAVSVDFKAVQVDPEADREVREASEEVEVEAVEDAVVAEAEAALAANFNPAPDAGLSTATSRASAIGGGPNPLTTDL
jgi:hypothetical protein